MPKVFVIEMWDYDDYHNYGTFSTRDAAEKALEILRQEEVRYNEWKKALFKKHYPKVYAVMENKYEKCDVEEHTVLDLAEEVDLPFYSDWEVYKEKHNEDSDIGAGV